MSFLTILDRLITVTIAHDTEMWMLMVKASKCQKLQICKQLTHSLLSFVWHKRMKLALSSVKKILIKESMMIFGINETSMVN